MPPRAVHKLEEAGWIFDSKKGGAVRFFVVGATFRDF